MKYSITLTLFMPMGFSAPSEKHRETRDILMLSEYTGFENWRASRTYVLLFSLAYA